MSSVLNSISPNKIGSITICCQEDKDEYFFVHRQHQLSKIMILETASSLSGRKDSDTAPQKPVRNQQSCAFDLYVERSTGISSQAYESDYCSNKHFLPTRERLSRDLIVGFETPLIGSKANDILSPTNIPFKRKIRGLKKENHDFYSRNLRRENMLRCKHECRSKQRTNEDNVEDFSSRGPSADGDSDVDV